MQFKDFLQDSAKEIDTEIDSFFSKWNTDVEHISSRLLPLTHALADACRGGKRIRGVLVKLGYKIGEAGSKNKSEILKIAIAYEIFQAAILAHDDIIDKSLLRRGKPSLYSRFGGDHSGISKAICLGDIGFFLAFRLIAESGFPEKEKNRSFAIFSKTMLETGIGELLDVELGQTGSQIAEIQDIITVYKFKTAYYTITAPLLLGAILGGFTDAQLEPIKIFGENLGVAFQIQDDIHDIFSEKVKLGKEAGGDIKEGKQTLLYVYAKEHATAQQKSLLKKYYGNQEDESSEIEAVKEVLIKTGALEYALSKAKSFASKARDSILGIRGNEEFSRMLVEMTEYFVR
jgi:geranylgeranyl diphosphate synthase type I